MNKVDETRAIVRHVSNTILERSNAMQKHVAVIFGETIADVTVQPGMTARDVLRAAGMPTDCWLSKPNQPVFCETEPLFGLIREGEKLEVSSKADVGR